MAKLIFQSPIASQTGFSNLSLSSSQATPEPVVRDLLQNSLDAYINLQHKRGGGQRWPACRFLRGVRPHK